MQSLACRCQPCCLSDHLVFKTIIQPRQAMPFLGSCCCSEKSSDHGEACCCCPVDEERRVLILRRLENDCCCSRSRSHPAAIVVVQPMAICLPRSSAMLSLLLAFLELPIVDCCCWVRSAPAVVFLVLVIALAVPLRVFFYLKQCFVYFYLCQAR